MDEDDIYDFNERIEDAMDNQAILTKAIQKSIDGGWKMFGFRVDDYIPPWYVVKGGEMPTPKVVEKWVPENSLLICDMNDHYYVWTHLIFNHDFAKALWGEGPVYARSGKPIDSGITYHDETCLAWQYHLQQMVIAEDPVKYLGENV